MKRITISLTDEEAANLARYAAEERRSPREMTAYLVVKHTPKPAGNLVFQSQPQTWSPLVSSSGSLVVSGSNVGMAGPGCVACQNPNNAAFVHVCSKAWTMDATPDD